MIIKEEQYELELQIRQSAGEGGVRNIHAWLRFRQGDINRRWIDMQGEDLTRLQGEAKSVARLIQLIEQGPRIPQNERKAT